MCHPCLWARCSNLRNRRILLHTGPGRNQRCSCSGTLAHFWQTSCAAMAKRTYADFAADSDTNLIVLTADGGRIPAHAEVLRLVCSCMKNAPAADTWDLRQLLVDGQHPTAETVSAVLEVIYQGMQALDFTMNKSPGRFSLLQLREMLLFADAVGCSKGCLGNMAALLGACVTEELQIPLAAERPSTSASARGALADCGPGRSTAAARSAPSAADQILLKLDSTYTLVSELLSVMDNGDCHVDMLLAPGTDVHIRAETARQLEQLLYAAFKLGLQRLQEPLLRFLRNNMSQRAGLLAASASEVLTSRVLCEAGSGAQQLVSRVCCQQPLGRGLGIGTYFQLAAGESVDNVRVTATMMRDLHEFSAGTRVELLFNLGEGNVYIAPLPDDDTNDDLRSEAGTSSESGLEPVEYNFGVVLSDPLLFDNPSM